jgi:hypothetical protein
MTGSASKPVAVLACWSRMDEATVCDTAAAVPGSRGVGIPVERYASKMQQSVYCIVHTKCVCTVRYIVAFADEVAGYCALYMYIVEGFIQILHEEGAR